MQYFVAVGEELHFGRAAKRLHVVQPAVSQQVRLLERDLGVDLFERSSRRVTLTEAGRLYLEEARKALQQVKAATQIARDVAEGTGGEVRIGFVDNAIWSGVSAIMRVFRERHPGIGLVLSQSTRGPLLQALLAGDVDIAILPAPVAAVQVHTQPLTRAPLEVVLPAGHRLTAREVVPVAALAQEKFISFSSVADPRRIDEIISAICAQAGFTPILGQAVHQMHTALALVSAGMGVTCVPPWMRRAWDDGVVYRPFTPEHEYALVLATLARPQSRRVAAFLDLAKEMPLDRSATP